MDYAYEDFLALTHGSLDDDYSEALELGAKFLANQQIGGVVVMPARRIQTLTSPPRIEPVDLLTADRDPYVLTSVLARLAEQVKANIVLVDLRAGISELSAPLLLDPRVHRVFTSTISDQSVRGTAQILSEIARRAPARDDDPDISVLLTQYSEPDHRSRLEEVATLLRQHALEASSGQTPQEGDSTQAVDSDARNPLMASRFDPRLLNLPASWDDVLEVIEAADIVVPLRPLTDALGRVKARPPAVADSGQEDDTEPDTVRQTLAVTAASLQYADTSTDQEFLVTNALDNLIEAHRTDPPIEVVIGNKGSGKTFTFLQLCTRGTWQAFADAAGVQEVSVMSRTAPVFWSTNLTTERADELVALRDSAARSLTGGEAAVPSALKTVIEEALASERSHDELFLASYLAVMFRQSHRPGGGRRYGGGGADALRARL